MAKVERSITINAPVDKVFSYITDPNSEVEYIPSAIEIRDITGQGVGKRYGWTYKIMGIPFKGESEVIEHVPNERYVSKSSGGIVSTWTWTFRSEDGKTLASLVVDYAIPVPVLGKFAERLVLRQIEREADLATATLKDMLQG